MYESYLYHHGIKGQRWGVRRFQNPDGTLTEEGKRHTAAFDEHQRRIDAVYAEGHRIVESDSRLKRDFGSYDQIDDTDYFEMIAHDYGIDLSKYNKVLKSQTDYYRDNKESINLGKQIVQSQFDDVIKQINKERNKISKPLPAAKTTKQKIARKIGSSTFATRSIMSNRYMNDSMRKQAINEQVRMRKSK